MGCAFPTPCHMFAGPAVEWARLTITYLDLERKYGNLFYDRKLKIIKKVNIRSQYKKIVTFYIFVYLWAFLSTI